MACTDVDGDFQEGLLFEDGTDNTFDDPIMNILNPPNPSGVFRGRFEGDSATFTGQCTASGQRTEITLTRTHNDGASTTYNGRVVRVDRGRRRVYVRGRFSRMLRKDTDVTAPAPIMGDWETEKPT